MQRVLGSPDARVHRLSLSLPRRMAEMPVWAGMPTQHAALGRRPGGDAVPRRVLLFGCGEISKAAALTQGRAACGGFTGPGATVRVLDKRYASAMPWEVNELVLGSDAGELGLRVGLKVGDDCRWWQWVRLETIDDGPVCRTIRAKGAIPVYWERPESPEAQEAGQGWAAYPWLHKHNHVRGEIVARCYANGVIELYVRHVNGRFFTEGGDLTGVIPIIGFRAEGGDWPTDVEPVSTTRVSHWDNAALNLAEASHLISEDHPGRAWREGDVCVYQPYEGVEARAGRNAKERTGDAYLSRAEDQVIPKGMGRTVRMVAALGDVAPEVAVYIAPDWWYGLSEEIGPDPLLPVRDHTWMTFERAMDYYRRGHHRGEFDDGAIPRGGPFLEGEPGWEGEAPHAQLVGTYLTGRADDYSLALRSAYHVADVAVDKTLFAVRMHGYVPPAQSLPMQRTMGLVTAWLENGDPYLLDTARSVTESAYWWDRHNWPRRSYGRDAAYIRGLVYLYRCLGERHYLTKAREALHRLVSCQLPDGSFADQGDTTGIHAAMNLIVKPWMGCIATEAMVDYLEVEPDAEIEAAALRFCRWLLHCRVDSDEGRHWTYQISYAGGDVGYRFDGTPVALGRGRWHVEYLARLLLWASRRTGDPSFYQAWWEAYRPIADKPNLWDHGANKIVANLPAQRQWLWGATPAPGGVAIRARTDLAPDLREAVLSTPDGSVHVRATDGDAAALLTEDRD